MIINNRIKKKFSKDAQDKNYINSTKKILINDEIEIGCFVRVINNEKLYSNYNEFFDDNYTEYRKFYQPNKIITDCDAVFKVIGIEPHPVDYVFTKTKIVIIEDTFKNVYLIEVAGLRKFNASDFVNRRVWVDDDNIKKIGTIKQCAIDEYTFWNYDILVDIDFDRKNMNKNKKSCYKYNEINFLD